LLSASGMSNSTVSTSIGITIMPARYTDDFAHRHRKQPRLPPRTLRRPKPLFYTVKTSAGTSQVFVYVARRVMMRCEWEEAQATGPILSETAALFILVTLCLGGRSLA
jgi:hypothetical protein